MKTFRYQRFNSRQLDMQEFSRDTCLRLITAIHFNQTYSDVVQFE